MTPDEAETFYEDDEPVEDIVAAFDRAEKSVTERPYDPFSRGDPRTTTITEDDARLLRGER